MIYPWLASQWSGFRERMERERLAHAILLHGPEGTGKNELSRHMVARMLCLQDGDQACGKCRSCALLRGGAHPDRFEVAPEEGKQQIVVDRIREVIASLALTTTISQIKVAVFSPAEAMNVNAANALLKNLEEPPGDTVMLLVSHDRARLPVTIRSRCQDIGVSLPNRRTALDWLEASGGIAGDAAEQALEAGGGSPLKAREMLDSDLVEQYQGVQIALSGILKRQQHTSAVAAQIESLEAGILWKWLSMNMASALKARLGGPVPRWLETPGALDARMLAGLQKEADRNRMMSGSALRQDLLLQEWLIKWSELAN